MNIQIIGTRKCRDTQKAQRFFKERAIAFHFKDLDVKPLSKGELDNIKSEIPVAELIDTKGYQYRKRNMSYIIFDAEEEILNDPLLIKTPIVRNGRLVTIGYQPETWKIWLNK